MWLRKTKHGVGKDEDHCSQLLAEFKPCLAQSPTRRVILVAWQRKTVTVPSLLKPGEEHVEKVLVPEQEKGHEL